MSREYLRERNGEIETVRQTQYTAEQKSRAIDVLRGSVVIVRHPYEQDPLSGAGNCWCGHAEPSSLHAVVVLGDQP